MYYRLDKRGADLAGGVSLLIFLLLTLIPLGKPWARLLTAALLSVAIWGYLRLLTGFAKWEICRGQLNIHIGLLLTREHHIRLNRITAIQIFSTPFSRPLGICLVSVFSAGAFSVMPCVRQPDAEQLILLWRAELPDEKGALLPKEDPD